MTFQMMAPASLHAANVGPWIVTAPPLVASMVNAISGLPRTV